MVDGKILTVDPCVAARDTEPVGKESEGYVFDPTSADLLPDRLRDQEGFGITLEAGNDVRSAFWLLGR